MTHEQLADYVKERLSEVPFSEANEIMTVILKALSGSEKMHLSDCSLHNSPAKAPSPCDCGAVNG